MTEIVTVIVPDQTCPECGGQVVFNPSESAWTENDKHVVIPTVCKKCGYADVANVEFWGSQRVAETTIEGDCYVY